MELQYIINQIKLNYSCIVILINMLTIMGTIKHTQIHVGFMLELSPFPPIKTKHLLILNYMEHNPNSISFSYIVLKS